MKLVAASAVRRSKAEERKEEGGGVSNLVEILVSSLFSIEGVMLIRWLCRSTSRIHRYRSEPTGGLDRIGIC